MSRKHKKICWGDSQQNVLLTHARMQKHLEKEKAYNVELGIKRLNEEMHTQNAKNDTIKLLA